MPELRCTQATALGLQADVLQLNPFTTDLEEYPPRPRPPDPAALPPSLPRLPVRPQPPVTVGYTSLEAYWWATLCRANTIADDTLLQQALNIRTGFTNYQRFVGGAGSLALNMWFAAFPDRFYIGLQGTANNLQAMQFILTHAVNDLAPADDPLFNSTFWNQAGFQHTRVEPVYAALGSNVPLCIMGHSYGGAVAHCLMRQLRSALAPALPFDRVVSFGAPRVFTPAAAADWLGYGENMQVVRFTNDGDLVPQLPPQLLVLRTFLNPAQIGGPNEVVYGHLGPSVFMDNDGNPQARQDLNLNFGDLVQQFAFYLGLAADPQEHTIARYSERAFNWFNNSPLSVTTGWGSYNSLQSINDALRALGA